MCEGEDIRREVREKLLRVGFTEEKIKEAQENAQESYQDVPPRTPEQIASSGKEP